ncbi:hypothetical protein ACWGMK_06090 [Agrobacterium deltaense]
MWKKLTLPRDGNEHNEWKIIQDAFETAFIIHRAPPKAAMFTDRDSNPGAISFYYSPEAFPLVSGFLSDYSVSNCETPSEETVTLLVGHDSARNTALL